MVYVSTIVAFPCGIDQGTSPVQDDSDKSTPMHTKSMRAYSSADPPAAVLCDSELCIEQAKE